MCLRLDDVVFINDFMMNYRELFSIQNAQSSKVLLEDIDFINKQQTIFNTKNVPMSSIFNNQIPEHLKDVEKLTKRQKLYFFFSR